MELAVNELLEEMVQTAVLVKEEVAGSRRDLTRLCPASGSRHKVSIFRHENVES